MRPPTSSLFPSGQCAHRIFLESKQESASNSTVVFQASVLLWLAVFQCATINPSCLRQIGGDVSVENDSGPANFFFGGRLDDMDWARLGWVAVGLGVS